MLSGLEETTTAQRQEQLVQKIRTSATSATQKSGSTKGDVKENNTEEVNNVQASSDIIIMMTQSSKIPFNLDRRVLLAIFTVIGFLTGNFFYAWPLTQVLYIRSGAFSWLCYHDDGDAEYHQFSSNNNNKNFLNSLNNDEIFDFVCDKQIQAINSLMPSGVAAMFVFAFIGGLSVDFLGPKISAAVGLTFQISGWALLAFCSQHFPFYLVANILMGLGNDPMFIALLDSSKLFSAEHQGRIIGLISASRSLSFVIPSIFNYILISAPYLSVEAVYLSYVSVLVICFIVVLLVFPWQCFSDPVSSKPDVGPVEAQKKRTALANLNGLDVRKGGKTLDITSKKSPSVVTTDCGLSDASFFSSTTSAGSTCSLSSQFHPSRVFPSVPEYGLSFTAEYSTRQLRDTSTHGMTTTVGPLVLPISSANKPTSHLWDIIQPGLYLPLLPIAATTILSGTFFANSAREQLGEGLLIFVLLSPLAFFSGVLMGYLSDVYSPLSVMCLMYILNLLQFILLLLESVSSIPSYFAAFLSLLVMSFFLTQFYCYIALTFPRRHFGVLSGFIVMCSGLFCLIVTPMCDFCSFASNYLPMDGLCLALTGTNSFFLYILYRNQGDLVIQKKESEICLNSQSSDSVEIPTRV